MDVTMTEGGRQALRNPEGTQADHLLYLEILARIGGSGEDHHINAMVDRLIELFGTAEAAIDTVKAGGIPQIPFRDPAKAIMVHILKACGIFVSQIGRDNQKRWRPNPWITKARAKVLAAEPATREEAEAAFDAAIAEGDLALPISREEVEAAIDAAIN
jgi:hypothetical protein